MHRVCETVRKFNLLTDTFISKMKKLLTNSPKMKKEFTRICKIALPKHPVITRWSTWLNAAFYYVENFGKIKEFLEFKELKQSPALKELRELIQNNNLLSQMIDLKKFEILAKNIIAIQDQSLSVKQQLKLISSLEKANLPPYALEKLKRCLYKNPDLSYFINSKFQNYELYAKLNTADIERSFSLFKDMFNDKRTSLSAENLEMFSLVLYNQFLYT